MAQLMGPGAEGEPGPLFGRTKVVSLTGRAAPGTARPSTGPVRGALGRGSTGWRPRERRQRRGAGKRGGCTGGWERKARVDSPGGASKQEGHRGSRGGAVAPESRRELGDTGLRVRLQMTSGCCECVREGHALRSGPGRNEAVLPARGPPRRCPVPAPHPRTSWPSGSRIALQSPFQTRPALPPPRTPTRCSAQPSLRAL